MKALPMIISWVIYCLERVHTRPFWHQYFGNLMSDAAAGTLAPACLLRHARPPSEPGGRRGSGAGDFLVWCGTLNGSCRVMVVYELKEEL